MPWEFGYSRDMDGAGVALAIGALKVIAFVYDVLTYPVYLILQTPWKVREKSRKIKFLQQQFVVHSPPEPRIFVEDQQNQSKQQSAIRNPQQEKLGNSQDF